jgi:DNA-binding HxlR family transcriptional regulator
VAGEDCPIKRSVSVLDGKWTLYILRELFQGTRRFGELLIELEGVSPKTLSDRLRSMQAQGIVQREVFAEVPPRVEYSLTPLGRTLEPVIESLRDWGLAWADDVLDPAPILVGSGPVR